MKTKIIATIGPASRDKETLSRLIHAGVRIFRLNFSHGDASAFVDIIRDLRTLEREKKIPLTLMQDLAGPKIRIGTLKDNKPLQVTAGMSLLIGPSEQAENMPPYFPYIPFDNEAVMSRIEIGDHLIIADGSMRLYVREEYCPGIFCVEAENSGVLTSRKGLTLPGKAIPVPALTEKDRKDLRDALLLGIDAVAISYVQTPEDIRTAKSIIRELGRNIPVVAKLERRGAVNRLEEILTEADIIMVARGDLGIECPLAEVPAIQKRIIKACNKAGKPVIVATQMLVSMVNNPMPTRAETTDVANAVWDGTDCVMMSEETAMGAYPVEAALAMNEIATRAEEVMAENYEFHPVDNMDIPEFLAYSVCSLADRIKAKGIVVHTQHGRSARWVSVFKPKCSVYAITDNDEVLRALNFSWGIHPRKIDDGFEEQHLERAERFIDASTIFAEGDFVIIAANSANGKYDSMRTDTVKIYRK